MGLTRRKMIIKMIAASRRQIAVFIVIRQTNDRKMQFNRHLSRLDRGVADDEGRKEIEVKSKARETRCELTV